MINKIPQKRAGNRELFVTSEGDNVVSAGSTIFEGVFNPQVHKSLGDVNNQVAFQQVA